MMSAIRRAAMLKMAASAFEMEVPVLRGELVKDEKGRWVIGGQVLDHLLNGHEGEEVVLVVGLMAEEKPVKARTCRTCGRDYMEMECPHCQRNRMRFRGR
ncbi:MAG TPA: hypothetical protein VLL52_12700 [Anaerolineae bacterium]|nr:hypothetical protein [Anaerolineae bacterium]